MGPRGVEREPGGLGLAQARLDRRGQARRLPEAREQVFPGLESAPLEDLGPTSPRVPGVGRVHDQAGVVDGLEQVADVPPTGRVDLPTSRRIVGHLGFFQAEAEPERAGDRPGDRASPLLDLGRQAVEVGPVAVHPPVRGAQRVEPLVVEALERRHRGPAGGLRSRGPGGPDQVVDHLAEEGVEDLRGGDRRGLGRGLRGQGSGGVGQGPGEVRELRGVEPDRHGRPPRPVAPSGSFQVGQEPLAGDERAGELEDLPPVNQGLAHHDPRRQGRPARGRQEQVHRPVDRQRQARDEPGIKAHRGPRGRKLGDDRARSHRPPGGRRQPGDEGLGLLGPGLADRLGQSIRAGSNGEAPALTVFDGRPFRRVGGASGLASPQTTSRPSQNEPCKTIIANWFPRRIL